MTKSEKIFDAVMASVITATTASALGAVLQWLNWEAMYVVLVIALVFGPVERYVVRRRDRVQARKVARVQAAADK